jgi:membrane associated rhomboid family serine protease/Tfp pilus assembly protein PilF
MANCTNCGNPLPVFGDAGNLCPQCRATLVAAVPAAARPSRPKPPVTTALVGLNFAVFVAMGLSGASWTEPNSTQLLRWGANWGPLTLGGQPWRALTSNYVHIGIVHILFNMWCLWDLGQLSERIFGRWTYLLVYTFSGLAGSVSSIWWHPLGVGAGASGAIFGLAGALIAALYLGQLPFPKQAMQRTLRSLLIFAAYNLFFGAVKAGVDNSAHIGGLVGGVAMGACLARSLTEDAETRARARQLVFAGSAAVLALAAMFVFRADRYVVLIKHAQDALSSGQPKTAVPDLQQVASERPKEAITYILLGNAYLQEKDYAQAEASLRRAVELEPDNDYAHYLFGLVYLQTSRYQQALDTFNHLQNPTSAENQVLIGDALRGLKRYGEALTMYRQVLKSDPRSAEAYLGIGEAQLALGHTDDAIASLQKSAEIDGNDSQIQEALARAYTAKGMRTEAEAAMRKAASLNEPSPPGP